MQDDLDFQSHHPRRSVSVFGAVPLRKAQASNDISGVWFVETYGGDERQNPLGLVILTHR
ncbi:hypothetical protein VC83_05134 [Pseudogymnoascus destructans]|uniref:Uncharacterized protein n=1 Tax=Pseudogymnoascus destructans TaxID=655981 RepID=A0A177AA05_9PEZI|nr:uncharacterized protein VC83_05134 [Pseudogymnoascus destructans]OAF58580.1 hypothetical protein VC83_05134 [Pseudogymnoascus destructans]